MQRETVVRRRTVTAVTALTGLVVMGGVVAPPAVAAPDISGKIRNAGPGVTLLLIGDDGSSVAAKVTRKGRFLLKPGRLTSRLMPRTGPGPTLHILRSGRYVGPVLFATRTKSTGYLRLAGRNRAPIRLGAMSITRSGYGRLTDPLKRSLLDTRRTGRLRAGVPLGAGNQGMTRLAAAGVRAGWVRAAGSALPADAAELGSDADRDGVPNIGDVDMNGDGILDAAQAETALPLVGGGRLSGGEVLTGRPQTATQFAKILNVAADSSSVNTNRTPGLTWPRLRDYLRENLQIEVLLGRGSIADLFCNGDPGGCAEARRIAALWMDCGQLAYCLPGSAATIIAPPDTGLDRQPLTVLRSDTGLIRIPVDAHTTGADAFERGFQLGFMPRVAADDGLQFAGDTFEFTAMASDGSVMGRQAKVLTSSVATPPEWSRVGGAAPSTSPIAITAEQARGLDLSFYRPQRLTSVSGATPQLADRGGLQYEVYIMGSGPGPSTFYWCRSSQVTPTHPDLVKVRVAGEMPGRDEPLYDSQVSPANGGELSFRLDVAGCLSDPASGLGSGAPPAPGSMVTVEMESQDSDGNRTRTRTQIVVP